MPLGKNIRYRFREIGKNKEQRLAFRGNEVVEAKTFQRKHGKVPVHGSGKGRGTIRRK